MALYVITGPPAAGKSTWVRSHARHGDITVDYDALANVLTPAGDDSHDHLPQVKAVTRAARQAAIDVALGLSGSVDVYIIHSSPSAELLAKYAQHDAQVITVDPGIDVTLARAKAERPQKMQGAVKRWYQENGSPRSDSDKIRSSHAWKMLAREFKQICKRRHNPDGSVGAPCDHCKQPIDYDAQKGTPSAFEADHIKPLATHPQLAYMRSNLRPSHSSCNRSHGAKGEAPGKRWVPAEW